MVEESNEKIYSIGFASLIASLIPAAFFGIGSYKIFNECNSDPYIAAILGILASILPLIVLLFIKKNSKGLDIIDLNIKLFGRVLGNILNITINLAYFFSAIVVFYNVSAFLSVHYLVDTSIIYIELILLLVISYCATKDIVVISKISQILFLINMVFFLFCQIGIFEDFKIDRIYPILSNGMAPVIKSSITYFVLASFPIFLVTIIPNYKIYEDKNVNKKVVILFIISNIIIFSIIFTTILTLGKDLTLIYRYPEYNGLKTFSLFKILERLENTLALQFVFNMFMFVLVVYNFIITSLKKVAKSKNISKIMPYILSIIVLIVANKFGNITDSKLITVDIFDNVVSFLILIPFLITTLGVLINVIKDKKRVKGY